MENNKKKIINKTIHFIPNNKNKKLMLISLSFFIIVSIGIIIYISNQEEKSIIVNGIKDLNDLDIETYNVKALSFDLINDEIITAPVSSNLEDENLTYNSYYLTSNTKLYKRIVTNTANNQGETVSTFDYEVLTISEFEEILDDEEDGIITFFWSDESKNCSNILISYE